MPPVSKPKTPRRRSVTDGDRAVQTAPPLFDVTVREVVGTVYEGGDTDPVEAGFMLACRALARGAQDVEFSFEGQTFHATVGEDKSNSLERMAERLRNEGYEVYLRS